MPTIKAQTAPVGAGFQLDAGDLRFIFHQIEIAQAHSAGGDLFGPGENQVNELRLPFGLRTVDGSFNHLESDKTTFGAADQVFPRLTTPLFRQAESHTFDPDGGGPLMRGDSSSYEQKRGTVNDSQPRIISNLIADQTVNNPAAAAVVAAGSGELIDENGDGTFGPEDTTFFIPNVAPDVGLSAPFNVMFTFFGQFFDHGLDLVTKGGGTVFVPLQPDDPLFVRGSQTNFMLLTRATNRDCDPTVADCVPDGVGDNPATPADESANDVQEATNTTTPFVDQNQTYTSHPSHQAFLRQYTLDAGGRPRSTGKMIDSFTFPGNLAIEGNIGNWGEVKAQARTMLGIVLVDADVFNVPLLVTDAYGYLLRSTAPAPAGFPMMMMANGTVDICQPADPCTTVGAAKTGHGFLDDIAHNAVPRPGLTPDPDSAISGAGDVQPAGTYDNELLNRHFVTGDGRGNENIALTAVHTIFHAEHNRLATQIPLLTRSVGQGGLLTPAEAAAWRAVDPSSGWDFGERVFQAAKFVTEMEYQHLVFEEFARKLVPSINEFIGDGINFQSDTNPAIVAEFAHQTYRLGHSMLTETISRTFNGPTPGSPPRTNDISLIDGFLNPVEFNNSGIPGAGPLTAAQAAGAIFRGGTRQVGNEIDEFVTEAVRNNLLGLPLDLPVLNLARGRSEGIPPLNEVRRQLFDATGDFALAPYDSWGDFEFALKHRESLINFVAAYGVDDSLLGPDNVRGTADDPNLAAKRDAAVLLVQDMNFMFAPGAATGVENIDLWIGGLAEKIAPFGGMLGTTFNYVFEQQLENLQNADRFYYLERLDGLNLLAQLEANSFVELIQRNTTQNGDASADVFSRPDFIFNLDFLGTTGPIPDDPTTADVDESDTTQEPGFSLRRLPDGTIRYLGPAHVIWNGRNVDNPLTPEGENVDRVFSSEGDDTLRGNGGNDIMEGGAGNDQHLGGFGDDILTDNFGEDVIKGGPGNDAISGGSGPFDLLQGNEGHDFIVGGNDVSETFGGPGNDIIFSGAGATEMFGGAGDDWIEGGPQLDLLVGDENNQFQNDPNQGHDVITGGKGDDDYDSEGGDDVMIADVLGTERLEGMLGFDWVTYRGDPLPVDADMNIRVVLPPDLDELRDRFDLAEALSGWNQNDILRGDDRAQADLGGDTNADGIARDHALTAVGINLFDDPDDPTPLSNSLEDLLTAFLGPGVTAFSGGNIILGGLGSDLIEGRGGDDLIDGDAWLNAQLRAPNPAAPATFQRVDSLHALKADVFARRINPGAIRIVRSIATSGSTGTDTALFSGPRANYTIAGPNAAGIVTVVDNAGSDGTDRLRNIEQLRFTNADGTFETISIGNNSPTGTPVLSQTLPQEGEQLSVATGTIADLDGIAAGSFGFQWQQAPAGSAAFVDIAGATLATFTPAQAQVGQLLRALVSFTDNGGRRETVASAPSGVVGDLFVGTAAADVFTGTAGRDNASGAGGNDTLTTGDAADVVSGQGGNDTLNTGAGNDTATGGAGDDTINAGDGNDSIRFNLAEGFDIVNGGAGTDEIRAMAANVVIGLTSLSGVESITAAGLGGVTIQGTEAANTLNFSAMTLTNIHTIDGRGGADVITGTAAADHIHGGGGADTVTGGGGADDLDGEEGTDTINGNAGNDIIWGGAGIDNLMGDAGADTMDGGADNDVITGGAGNDSMNPGATLGNDVFRFAAGFGADTIAGFGATQDLTTGQDRLNLVALGITAANFAANVTVAASGANTLITIRNPGLTTIAGTITLIGVLPGAVTAADFVLAP